MKTTLTLDDTEGTLLVTKNGIPDGRLTAVRLDSEEARQFIELVGGCGASSTYRTLQIFRECQAAARFELANKGKAAAPFVPPKATPAPAPGKSTPAPLPPSCNPSLPTTFEKDDPNADALPDSLPAQADDGEERRRQREQWMQTNGGVIEQVSQFLDKSHETTSASSPAPKDETTTGRVPDDVAGQVAAFLAKD